jgi:diguanylate cyclase (GGDEF)-like protein
MKIYLDKFIIFLIVLLVAFATYLQLATLDSTDKLRANELHKSQQYIKKIATLIQKKTGNNIEQSLTQSKTLRKDLNEILEAFLTKEYRYSFMLYKDNTEHFRFLLDASEDEKEDYKAFFFPHSDIFDKVYKDGKARMIEQSKGVKDVWMSFLYPIIVDGKTEAILSLELSQEYSEYINTFNSPLMGVLKWMQLFLISSILVLLFLAYKYYQLNKTLHIDKRTKANTKLYINNFFDRHKINKYNGFLVDIDEFKGINELYGHDIGDKLIKLFVKRMQDKLSDGAKVVSSGGTEFLIFIPKTTDKIRYRAEEFYKEIKEIPYIVDGHTMTLSISMSAMCIPDEAKLLSNVQRVLDEQLLIVKNRGKNNLIILDDSHIDTLKYGNFDYVKESINAMRICCLYQPIVRLVDDKIAKYEALVRLIDKEDNKKLVSPTYFLKTIKNTSQYIKMSKMVLEDVFATLEKYPQSHISMNLDLDDLYNVNLMTLITQYLEENKEMSPRLTFEIIEENNIYDYDKVNSVFEQLKLYGSKIAIDDFGSGYSNYIYLTKLNVDIIKIDGSLINALISTPKRSKIILKSIKELAEKLNLEIVAEFISSKEIHEEVKKLGISYGQGYHLGKPEPIEFYESVK